MTSMLAMSRTLTAEAGAVFSAAKLIVGHPPPPSYGEGRVGESNGRILAPILTAALPSGPAGPLPRFDGGGDLAQLSLAQSRAVIFFSVAYLAAVSLTSGRRMPSSPVYQSEITFHCLPSHWWTRLSRAPS